MLKEKKKSRVEIKPTLKKQQKITFHTGKKGVVNEGIVDYSIDSGAKKKDFFTIKEASEWATKEFGRTVTTSNISYLIQYGRVKKIGENGTTLIEKKELEHYYESYNGKREINWKEQLGDDLNWALSFDQYKEAETTKHVHRLHPYKGKFIPQLVEYFLDAHKDAFKKQIFFNDGDIVLDPFCGSGTTLVQASELGMHAVGIDISAFNGMISSVKVGKYDFADIKKEVDKISVALYQFIVNSNTVAFENRLLQELNIFNNKYFPVPEYKYQLAQRTIDENKYGSEKEKAFLPIYYKLIDEYKIELKQDKSETFLDKWFLKHVRTEIDFVYNMIGKIKTKKRKMF